LRKLNKTKDEFISIVWHELRTPLTSIRWYLSMILDWDMWEINPEIKKAINHTYDSSVRLIKLVNDILSLWKIESWKMEYDIKEIKILNLINSVYKDIHLEIDTKWIKFVIDIEKSLEEVEIKTDKDKIKQIFLNLLNNALKFTKKWWTITLKVSKIKNKIRFEVIDTWIWIPKDKLNILFNKFSQVESTMQRHNTSWLGLWLAISKNFIKEFWSEIKVKSIFWKWSNFYFDL
jgi:signal transduction histidine kinase